MGTRTPVLTPGRGLAVALVAGWATCLALNWPGWLSPDSVWQLLQGRAGDYDPWHPPVMAWMLGLFDRLSPGPPGFVVFDAALGYGGLAAFGMLGRPVRPLAIAVATLLCLSPLMLIYQADVWKDVLFADAGVAGFAALAWAARLWPRRGLRAGLLGLAALAFALATLARQNGAIVAAGGVIATGWIAKRNPLLLAGKGRSMSWALAMFSAIALVAGLGQVALSTRTAAGDGGPGEMEWLQVWDLAGAVHADPKASLHGLRPDTAAFIRAAAPAWTPRRMDSLVVLPGAGDALDQAGPAVARRWAALILTRPDLYARVRLADFAQVLATPNLRACRPLFLGQDGPPEMLAALKLAPPDPVRLKLGRAYALAFVGSPALSHPAYLVLAIGLFAVAWRGRSAEDGVVAAMLASAGAFAASFAIAGVACDYRYLYALDLFAMAALVHRCACGWPAKTPDAG